MFRALRSILWNDDACGLAVPEESKHLREDAPALLGRRLSFLEQAAISRPFRVAYCAIALRCSWQRHPCSPCFTVDTRM